MGISSSLLGRTPQSLPTWPAQATGRGAWRASPPQRAGGPHRLCGGAGMAAPCRGLAPPLPSRSGTMSAPHASVPGGAFLAAPSRVPLVRRQPAGPEPRGRLSSGRDARGARAGGWWRAPPVGAGLGSWAQGEPWGRGSHAGVRGLGECRLPLKARKVGVRLGRRVSGCQWPAPVSPGHREGRWGEGLRGCTWKVEAPRCPGSQARPPLLPTTGLQLHPRLTWPLEGAHGWPSFPVG